MVGQNGIIKYKCILERRTELWLVWVKTLNDFLKGKKSRTVFLGKPD